MSDSKQRTARSGPAVRGSRPAGPGPARRSTAMRVWLVTRGTGWWSSGWPAYPPKLHPVEGLSSSGKAMQLANRTTPNLAEALQQAPPREPASR